MGFKKISAPSLKGLFVKELESMILSGELQVGEKLPSERILAEQMGVSRTIVNAGLAEMEGKGFLEIRPRIGVFVADYRRSGSLTTLVSIMSYNGRMLRRDEVKALLEVRSALETLILKLVVPKITMKEFLTMEQILEDIRNCQNGTEFADCCFRFDHELCIISGNILLPLYYGSFREPCCNLWLRYYQLYGKEPLIQYNEQLLAFIRSGDLTKALKLSEYRLKETIDGERQLYY
ncbi:FadR/GntR family transcriptional regulator [Bariatricus sp. SGI.154]|uniref:FadR/GntR family transcriptional regulator n=1 Tax=Bariatricus sp. SGI.154 TaxID=3420549 RepID=UPI003CFF679B